jgi:hypothetical protein
MTGSVFIADSTGWGASNDVLFHVDRDINEVDGKKVSKHTNILKIKSLFLYGLEVLNGKKVDVVFKFDDNNKLEGFTGLITGQTNTSVAVRVLTKTERIQEILNKIKEEI